MLSGLLWVGCMHIITRTAGLLLPQLRPHLHSKVALNNVRSSFQVNIICLPAGCVQHGRVFWQDTGISEVASGLSFLSTDAQCPLVWSGANNMHTSSVNPLNHVALSRLTLQPCDPGEKSQIFQPLISVIRQWVRWHICKSQASSKRVSTFPPSSD